ncbi:expressed unknown protein [Seminavis robusta]|uniref:Uncharacterized protein n=1 Tax=Seminavis robusta TaxID=568900 RepID=A0A9N8F130_9STRA|nr:expressed unknown protein [Seminavis robusta]|eukprot:Sro2292_g322250.1 n/a (354) ;mRNA; r:12853-14013
MSSSTDYHHNDEEMMATPLPPAVEENADCLPSHTTILSTNGAPDNNGSVVQLEHLEVIRVCEDEDDDDTLPKPQRKNTDATSMTGSSSFLDDGSEVDCDPVKTTKPPSSLDLVHEEDEDDTKVEDSCCWKWCKILLFLLVVVVAVLFTAVMVGAVLERNSYSGKEGTNHYYTTPQMCGVDNPLTDTGVTFPSLTDLHNAGSKVAHCGDCGACSTAHDMDIMGRTADSLTKDSTACAFKIFFGRRAVEKCMEERVGFTPACEDCWLDNIACSFKKCKFTCIKYKLFRQDNNKADDDLNDCLKCDERSCGPGFIECSGANRRRMGVVSDIGREAVDQCEAVDVDWTTVGGDDNNN